MPLDPRTSTGVCAALSAASPFVGKLKPSQTGGVGAGTIDPAFSSRYGVWPPASINSGGAASLLPAYTPTGTLSTLPVPTFTQLIVASATATVTASFSSVDPGNGWFAKGDAAKAYVPIAGCTYPDNWDALTAQIPGAQCVAGATAPATVPDAATPATPAATDPAAAVTPAPGPAAPSPATKRMHVVEARVTLMA